MRRNDAGSVMAILLMVATLMLMLAAVVSQNALQNMRSTHSDMDRTVARYAAFAGMQRAFAELVANATFEGQFTNVSLPNSPDLYFSVVVDNGQNGADPNITPPDVTLTNDTAYITANATYRHGTVVKRLSGLEGLAVRDTPKFENAILAGTTLAMTNNSHTYAYNFTTYRGQARENGSTNSTDGYLSPNDANSTLPRGAEVRTNGAIGVNNGSKIEGDVTVPMGDTITIRSGSGTVTVPTNGNLTSAQYTGQMHHAPAKFISRAVPPCDPATAVAVVNGTPPDGYHNEQQGNTTVRVPDWHTYTQGAYKSLTINQGQEAYLSAGTYYFDDFLDVQGKLHVTGDVVIYVGKKMVVGGDVNFQGNPQSCQVYFTDADNTTLPGEPQPPAGTNVTVSRLQMNSGARATMVAAGQNLRTYMDHARLLGAVIGDIVGLSESKVEFDQGLLGRTFAMDAAWKLTGIHEKGQ